MFKCMECGRKFRTTRAAEKAAFGNDGCPRCGGSDIDLDPDPLVGIDPLPPRISTRGLPIDPSYDSLHPEGL